MNQTTVTVNPISNTTLTTNAPKAFKCEICSATFTEKLYFDLHKQTHQKEMPVVQILMNPGTAHQVIPQPSPAHQGSAQIIIQEDQLASYKRAYGVEPQQVYTLAPVTQYQVITTNNRNGTQSLSNQVNIPTFSAPTYVVAAMGDGHQLHTIPEAIIQQHDQQQIQQQPQPQQHQQQQQSSSLAQQEHVHHQQNQEQGQVEVHVSSQNIEVSGNHNKLGRNVISQKDRPFKCDQCTASFIESNELEEHKKKHTGDGPFTCEDCHFTFMYKSHFKSHKTRCLKKRAMMSNPPKMIITSPQVKRQFPTNHNHQVSHKYQFQQQQQQQQPQQHQQQPQQHQQQQQQPQHHQQQQQQQHIYQQNTIQNQQLHQQQANHNNQTVGKHFVSTVVANKGHISRQNAPKNAMQAKFNPSNPSFKRIKKESRLDRPYECDECDASFQNDQDLKNHKSKHTGDGPFTCNDCRFVFLYRKLYEAHRRRCEKKRKGTNVIITHAGTISDNIGNESAISDNQAAIENENASAVGNMVMGQPQITHVQSLHNLPQHQHQELSIQAGQTIATAVPASSLPSVLSGALQMHPVTGQHAIIEVRQANSQNQELQQVPLHPLIEQVLVAPPGTTMSTIGGNRHDFKYEVVSLPASALSEIPDGNVNQIMGLIKVKSPNQ